MCELVKDISSACMEFRGKIIGARGVAYHLSKWKLIEVSTVRWKGNWVTTDSIFSYSCPFAICFNLLLFMCSTCYFSTISNWNVNEWFFMSCTGLETKGFSWKAREKSHSHRSHSAFRRGAVHFSGHSGISLRYGKLNPPGGKHCLNSVDQLHITEAAVTWTVSHQFASTESSMFPSIWPHLATHQTSIAITGRSS